MKYIICILLILNSISIYSQKNNKLKATQNVDSIVKLLESKIELGQSNQQKLDSINTELKNQLIIYKAKEDYFAAALGDQSTRFALIIGAILGFLGLISFSWYKIEKKTINDKFNAFNIEFTKIKEKYNELNSHIFMTSANAYVILAFSFRDGKDFVSSLLYETHAAYANYNTNIKTRYSIIIANLKGAIDNLDDIKKDTKFKDGLLDDKSKILENIEVVQNAEDEEIKNLCAKIRTEINNYLK